jgi:uncharacterized protein YciI
MARLILGWLGIAFALAGQTPRYEMDTYVMVFLKRGPKWTAESTPETQKIQAGHMAHIQEMAKSGKLAVAGPFAHNGAMRGILIFHRCTLEQGRQMAENDPAVKAGRLAIEAHPWRAAKGLRVDEPKP